MSMTKIIATTLASIAAPTAFAHGGATMFKTEEFGAVANAAIAQFKIDAPAHYDHFYGITLSRQEANEEEVGLAVKIYVKHDEASAPVVQARYLCHKHEADANELECHPQ